MLCKHEVVGSIPSGSTRTSDRAAFGRLAGPDFGLSNIKFRPGASSLARVIHHRKEEMHPVGFGRRRSVALVRKGSRVGSSSSVFSQWASLTASLPGVFEANWSLSVSPGSCRLSGWAYASKKIEHKPGKLQTFRMGLCVEEDRAQRLLAYERGPPRRAVGVDNESDQVS